MNELISVIIVNWNGKKWLEKCLTSIIHQTYKKLEIIIVDNASQDDSIPLVEKKFPKVKVVKSENNLGFAKANNLGIKKSKGKYIFFINNDTWIKKTLIEKLYKEMIQRKIEIIAPLEKNYYGEYLKCSNILTIDILGYPYFVKKEKNRSSFYLPGSCILFNKDIYLQTGGLDNNFFMYFEEADWFWRLNLMKIPFGYSKNLYYYHWGKGSTSKGIDYKKFLWRNQNCLQMLLKNYSFLTLCWIIPIYLIQNIIEIMFCIILLKPKIAYSYIEGWLFNIRNIKKITKKRALFQKKRKVNDLEIIKKLYWGSGKLNHLIEFNTNNEESI